MLRYSERALGTKAREAFLPRHSLRFCEREAIEWGESGGGRRRGKHCGAGGERAEVRPHMAHDVASDDLSRLVAHEVHDVHAVDAKELIHKRMPHALVGVVRGAVAVQVPEKLADEAPARALKDESLQPHEHTHHSHRANEHKPEPQEDLKYPTKYPKTI